VSQEQIDACKPIHSAWNELAKMWTFPIINALGLGTPARFNELKRRIEGISATSLAERLTYLQRSGVVGRKVFPETPPRVEYSLTNKGWELHEILGSLADWVRRWEDRAPLLDTASSSR
jgi:DNA-binding HxlR family transcriptional regulator